MNSWPGITGERNGDVLQKSFKVVSMARTEAVEEDAGIFRAGGTFGWMKAMAEGLAELKTLI